MDVKVKLTVGNIPSFLTHRERATSLSPNW
jgi:hypothetical protein